MKGLKGKEIAELRRQGENVNQIVEKKLFAFLGLYFILIVF